MSPYLDEILTPKKGELLLCASSASKQGWLNVWPLSTPRWILRFSIWVTPILSSNSSICCLIIGNVTFPRICLRQYQSNIAWFLSTRDLPKQAWHNIWPRVSLCQQLDWSVYLLLYIFQTQLSICTYLHVTCHNSFHVNIMRVTTTLTPSWEVHIAFSRLQIGFASTRKVQWPIFNSALSYLVFQSIVLLAKTWRGHLEIGSRNNNSRCLASPHLQNSSYLFFSRVEVCILDCFPCTHILTLNPRIRKKLRNF